MPADCSMGWVGLERKSKVGKYRVKNIKLKVVNEKKGPAELMWGVCTD